MVKNIFNNRLYMKSNIVAVTKAAVSVDSIRRVIGDLGEITFCPDKDSLLAALPGAEILIVQNKGFPFRMIDGSLLDCAPKLKLIQHHGVMCDATDAVAARSRGITVAVTSGSNDASVAEITWHIVMSVAKKIAAMQNSVRLGQMGDVLCTEMAGKTICIVGVGRIGIRVARAATAFDMRVIGVRRSAVLDAGARAAGISQIFDTAHINEAIALSDFIVLALPLNDETYNLIGRPQFSAMKKGAALINISRGNNVDREALETALRQGNLGGYGTDVWWVEPAPPTDPLLLDPRVYVTPHIGAESREAIDRMSLKAKNNILRYFRNECLENVINA